MSLYRYAGKLLRLASGALAKACCCARYWCVPDGMYCDMLTYTCLPNPQPAPDKFGPYEENTCNFECPGPEECWPPVPYYCCYYSLDEYGQPAGGTYCQSGPCPSLALTASGPHRTAAECAYNCQPHACVPAVCTQCPTYDGTSGQRCVPSASGTYLTAAQCRQACGCVKPCALVSCREDRGFERLTNSNPPFPPSCGPRYNVLNEWNVPFAQRDPPYWRTGGATPPEGTSLVFWVDYEPNKPICVSYVSLNGRPIRVQITAPRQACAAYDGNKNESVRRDSGWRGLAGCDCPSSRPAGAIVGGPKGTLRWNTKPANVGWFHVRVFAPCSGASWKIGVGCDCPTIPEEPCCDCSQCVISQGGSDDDRTNSSFVNNGALQQRYDGIYREASRDGVNVPAPSSVEWKQGYPSAFECRPWFWWRSSTWCYNSAMGPFQTSPTTGATVQFAASGVTYWRLFVCENGTLVNRTQDAVTAAVVSDCGNVRITVANTVGGQALACPVSIAGADPTGQPGGAGVGGAVSCPIAVDQIAPLDPTIAC